jgi:methylglyoxal/glyoxal reductase
MTTRTVTLLDGTEVPALGLGLYLIPAGDETVQTMKTAIRLGYRNFDGAAFYDNEASVGEAFAAVAAEVPREDLFYTSKVWTTDRTHDDAVRSIERSVRESGGPLDMALVHWPVPGAHVEIYRGLVTCLKRGLCKRIGLSNYMPSDYEELVASGLIDEAAPMLNQIEISPKIYRKSVIDFFSEKGIVMQAFKPLERGAALSDEAFASIAARYNTTVAAVLLRWSAQKGFSVLCKSKNEDRLLANKEAVDGNAFNLSDEDMATLDGLTTDEARAKAAAHYEKRRAGTAAPWGDGPRPA